MNLLSTIWYKFLQPLGIGLAIFWMLALACVYGFDGSAVHIPGTNTTMLIYEGGYHFYTEELTVEYK